MAKSMRINPIIKQVVEYFGTQRKFAKKLNVTHQYVNSWYKCRALMPAIYAYRIEKLTKGVFSAEDLLDSRDEPIRKKKK
jgi:DNA-binding transcriptional regulator YdaS (Cro superfamily)